VFSYLEDFAWPGNVRQLENVVERAVALNTSGVFDVEDLPEEIQSVRRPAARRGDSQWLTLEQMEDRYIREVLEGTGGNISRAAEILGIDRRTLYRKLEKPVTGM
jgi:DNA-binding NtrC family response regulator